MLFTGQNTHAQTLLMSGLVNLLAVPSPRGGIGGLNHRKQSFNPPN